MQLGTKYSPIFIAVRVMIFRPLARSLNTLEFSLMNHKLSHALVLKFSANVHGLHDRSPSSHT